MNWTFDPARDGYLHGDLIPDATPESLSIEAYNLDQAPVRASITPWDLEPGKWEIVQDGTTRTIDL